MQLRKNDNYFIMTKLLKIQYLPHLSVKITKLHPKNLTHQELSNITNFFPHLSLKYLVLILLIFLTKLFNIQKMLQHRFKHDQTTLVCPYPLR
jgi:hypothetical protein